MILQFPDLTTLQLALTSGTIGDAAAICPAEVAWVDDGSIWVDSDIEVSRASREQLRAWGVVARRSRRKITSTFEEVRCWPQLIPLERENDFRETSDKTPVLFELPDESVLPEVVNEILRQGNDRQSFRTVSDNSGQRVLLRVLGPPYYSLLRALDRPDTPDAIRAFIERSPRVWVQVGYRHVLADRIKPAAGQHVMLEPRTRWRTLKEQPFRDIYESLDFQLPQDSVELTDTESRQRLKVPVRIVRGGSDDTPELFVLKTDAIRQLDQFVRATSDDVLDRLAFVVSHAADSFDADPTVVIRIRPGRTSPPVLVFDGLACRRYLKIPNLFIPVGQRLHPPLRRDAVKSMLAEDEGRIVWLDPADAATTTTDSFVLNSVEDSAFRPLSQWVDYIIDRDAISMAAWKASHQFDFEDFVCRDDKPKTSKKRKQKVTTTSQPIRPTEATEQEDIENPIAKLVRRFRKPGGKQQPTDQQTAELEQHLKSLETGFRKLEAPLDDPARETMWSQMAQVNLALSRFGDASICRQHELWEQEPAKNDSLQALFQIEVTAAQNAKVELLPDHDGVVNEQQLVAMLKTQSPSPIHVSQVAGFLAWGCQNETAAALIRSHLATVQNFLKKNEGFLSVRACWLAWVGLSHLSGDVLTLARARDRMLQGLYQQGLIADRDLPSFLRVSSSQAGDRFRAVRGKVAELHQHVRGWSKANLAVASAHTLNYVDLVFAYAFARLGEMTLASETMLAAAKNLRRHSDPVHGWLCDAFEYRIQQANSGEPVTSPLPDDLLGRLDGIPKLARYKVDRLRQHSTILEPHEQLDPYRNWRRRNANDLQHELSELFDIFSRKDLLERLRELFNRKLDPDNKARLTTTALELSTRLGEKFAVKMLAHVVPTDSKLDDTLLRAGLLEKGLHISAHYDQTDFAHACLERMHRLIDAQGDADVATLEALESLMSRSFNGLRKLGMREENAALLNRMTKQVRPPKARTLEPERMRVLLQLAGGWFYFGQDRGWKDIDAVRKVLLSNKLTSEGHVGAKKQTDLAVAYIRAVGQAPLNDAVDRLNELFDQLRGIHDSATVNTHYSLKQLDVVDALVQTIVSDSFTLNKESQRWLDDEEFLIRRRIHRDVRQMMPT